jgi:hypothetical protein
MHISQVCKLKKKKSIEILNISFTGLNPWTSENIMGTMRAVAQVSNNNK